jgi:hypothetical protein
MEAKRGDCNKQEKINCVTPGWMHVFQFLTKEGIFLFTNGSTLAVGLTKPPI